MPFVALWSGAASDSWFSEVRVVDTFDSIFVPATKRPGLIQAYPISSRRSLLEDRQLSLRCILSRPALSCPLALAPHQHQVRNRFVQTSRSLLLEASHTFWVLHCSWLDGETVTVDYLCWVGCHLNRHSSTQLNIHVDKRKFTYMQNL